MLHNRLRICWIGQSVSHAALWFVCITEMLQMRPQAKGRTATSSLPSMFVAEEQLHITNSYSTPALNCLGTHPLSVLQGQLRMPWAPMTVMGFTSTASKPSPLNMYGYGYISELHWLGVYTIHGLNKQCFGRDSNLEADGRCEKNEAGS